MNVALSAVLISILLIPPVVFYLSLYAGPFPRPTPKFSIFERILTSAVVSLLIHGLAISLISAEIRFDLLLKLLGGELKDVEHKFSNAEFKHAVLSFSLYNATLLIVMVIFGRVVRQLLLWRDYHSYAAVLNLYNKWWYLFNGYYTNKEDFDMLFVDVVTDTREGTVIYSGYLESFECIDGNLDRIYLKELIRREFNPPAQSAVNSSAGQTFPEAILIPGDVFSISYAQILNINLQFMQVQDRLEEIELPQERQ